MPTLALVFGLLLISSPAVSGSNHCKDLALREAALAQKLRAWVANLADKPKEYDALVEQQAKKFEQEVGDGGCKTLLGILTDGEILYIIDEGYPAD